MPPEALFMGHGHQQKKLSLILCLTVFYVEYLEIYGTVAGMQSSCGAFIVHVQYLARLTTTPVAPCVTLPSTTHKYACVLLEKLSSLDGKEAKFRLVDVQNSNVKEKQIIRCTVLTQPAKSRTSQDRGNRGK